MAQYKKGRTMANIRRQSTKRNQLERYVASLNLSEEKLGAIVEIMRKFQLLNKKERADVISKCAQLKGESTK